MCTPSLLSRSSPWVCWCVFFGTLLSGALAYPSGAPESVCNSMVPSHGPSQNTYTDPFGVTVSSSTYSPGQSLTVTIASTLSNVKVKGFMLQARLDSDRNGNSRLGTFSADSDTKTQCSGGASTHKFILNRQSITVTWQAPSTSQGDIVFRATVVRLVSDYYTEVYSATISPSSSTTTMSTSTITTSTTTTSITTTPNPDNATVTPTVSTMSPSSSTSSVSGDTNSSTTTQAEQNTRPVDVASLTHCNLLLLWLLLVLVWMMPWM